MTPVHVIEATLVGTLTALLAAADNSAAIGWQIIIFATGIIVGAVCVTAADWHLRRQEDQREVQSRTETGRDA